MISWEFRDSGGERERKIISSDLIDKRFEQFNFTLFSGLSTN